MTKIETILSVFATIITVVAFIEKHSSFFVGVGAMLSIGWWCFIYCKKIIFPFINSFFKNKL